MTRTARTQSARTILARFLRWWQEAPLYQSIWFVPLVMVIYIIAVIKNLITGDK
jgi:hypothetical protein